MIIILGVLNHDDGDGGVGDGIGGEYENDDDGDDGLVIEIHIRNLVRRNMK